MQTPAFRYGEYRDWFEVRYRGLPLPETPLGLYGPMDYHLQGNGKRIRPAILAETAAACGVSWDDSLPAALAIELLHNFTLVHDDLMDGDDRRHGQPTLHAKYNSSTAILTGDAMYAYAWTLLDVLPDAAYRRVSALLAGSILKVCEGQSLDMEFESDSTVTMQRYLRMIELKTGYLLSASLQAGAVMGGMSDRDLETIHRYALELGRIFQMQDDLLELTSDADSMGKSLDSDIRAGKKTFPLLTAMEEAETNNDRRVQDLLKRKNYNDQEIIEVKELFRNTELRNIVEDRIRTRLKVLNGISAVLDARIAGVLGEISQFILDRKT